MTQSSTPWNNDYGNPKFVRAKTDSGRGTLQVCECLDADDAALIVRAVNERADMLAALKECAEYLGSLPPGGTREPLYLAYSAAIDAIDKAEK